MAAVALVGLVRGMADLVEAGLRSEGHTVATVPLDTEAVQSLGRRRPDVVVLDGHAYATTRALLTDLRAQPATADLPVVLLGPARPAGVPHFEVVQQRGRTLEMDDLLAAVRRALSAPYTGSVPPAGSDSRGVSRCLAADEVLAKPLDVDLVLELVARYVRQRRLRRRPTPPSPPHPADPVDTGAA